MSALQGCNRDEASLYPPEDVAYVTQLSLHKRAEVTLSSVIEQAKIQFGRRSRQFRELLTVEGPRGITDRIRTAGAFWRVTLDVVPASVLKSDSEDIHDGMIESFPAGFWIELLRIVCARTNHAMCVVAGMDDHLLDL